MAGTAALGLFRELRTQPTRSRLRTSRRGQVEHRPVATSPASARPPRLAHSKRATSCRKGSSTRRSKIPDHLDPGQARVIPPPRPSPRAAFLPRPLPGPGPARRPRPARPAAPAATAPTTARTPSAAEPPGQPAVSPARRPAPRRARSSRSPSTGSSAARRAELPVRIQRRSQHIPQRCLSILRIRDNTRRNRHAAQQTPSAAANHAPRASVSQPTALWTPNIPSHEFRILKTLPEGAHLPFSSGGLREEAAGHRFPGAGREEEKNENSPEAAELARLRAANKKLKAKNDKLIRDLGKTKTALDIAGKAFALCVPRTLRGPFR